MMGRQPIATAPRDQRVIVVGHEEVGEFPMAWNPNGTNSLFAPGVVGIWEMVDGTMTWSEADDLGPSYWRELIPPVEG